jgi:hypothetical protein
MRSGQPKQRLQAAVMSSYKRSPVDTQKVVECELENGGFCDTPTCYGGDLRNVLPERISVFVPVTLQSASVVFAAGRALRRVVFPGRAA